MTPGEIKKLNAQIAKIVATQTHTTPVADLKKDLDRIAALIDGARCYQCDSAFKRGGNKQGSELCAECFNGD